jgi:two-component system cell cycle response regulator
VLARAAELRDVGLVAVPDEILDSEDRETHVLYRSHPIAGARILSVAESMRPVARLVRSSHERYDGSGFPEGLRGEEIPLGARIIAACALDPRGQDPRVVAMLSAASCAR